MRIVVEYDDVVSKELMEKAKGIKTYYEFVDIADKYGWNETITAFRNTHEYYNEDKVEDYINDYFDSIIQDVIEKTLIIEKFRLSKKNMV